LRLSLGVEVDIKGLTDKYLVMKKAIEITDKLAYNMKGEGVEEVKLLTLDKIVKIETGTDAPIFKWNYLSGIQCDLRVTIYNVNTQFSLFMEAEKIRFEDIQKRFNEMKLVAEIFRDKFG